MIYIIEKYNHTQDKHLAADQSLMNRYLVVDHVNEITEDLFHKHTNNRYIINFNHIFDLNSIKRQRWNSVYVNGDRDIVFYNDSINSNIIDLDYEILNIIALYKINNRNKLISKIIQ